MSSPTGRASSVSSSVRPAIETEAANELQPNFVGQSVVVTNIIDRMRTISPDGITLSSSETKPLGERSTIQVEDVSADEFQTLLLKKTFSNDIHYKVKGDLHLWNLNGLTALPQYLSVEGDLDIIGCNSLTALPETLTVGGNLTIFYCISLTALPETLTVGGHLTIMNCTGLTALPEGLTVGGNLAIDSCPSLTALPETLTVGGNLSIMYCTDLTALPNWITQLGSTSQGTTRVVILENTGLSDAIIDRLRNVLSPGMRFQFSRRAAPSDKRFLNIEEAYAFWRKLASSGVETATFFVSSHEVTDLIAFLERLTETADYKNQNSRPVLAQRVIDIMRLLGDERVKGDALRIIHDATSSCGDRVILALDNLETLQLLTSAKTMAIENNDSGDLRRLGLQMMRLDEVKKIARDHMETLTWVDEIEVELAFQIAVREHLELPGTTQHMLYRRCASVSDQDIAKAVEQVSDNCSGDKFEAYLDQWEPWKQYQRQQNIPVFDCLDTKTVGRIKECSLLFNKTDEMIAVGDHHFDYNALCKAYTDSGKNPVTNQPLAWSTVVRLREKGATQSLRTSQNPDRVSDYTRSKTCANGSVSDRMPLGAPPVKKRRLDDA